MLITLSVSSVRRRSNIASDSIDDGGGTGSGMLTEGSVEVKLSDGSRTVGGGGLESEPCE